MSAVAHGGAGRPVVGSREGGQREPEPDGGPGTAFPDVRSIMDRAGSENFPVASRLLPRSSNE